MTTQEFSDQFDILVDGYRRMKDFDDRQILDSLDFDEYEKSLFLTKAQKEYVISYYTGRNIFGYSIEEKELVREALDALINTYTTSTSIKDSSHLDDGKHIFTFYDLPMDLLWILYEQVTFAQDTGCVCADGKYAEIIPATHDELHRRLRNPFRGPLRTRVLRLNAADNLVELVSDYPIGSYTLRYVQEPLPIILTNLTDGLSIDGMSDAMTCQLPDIVHHQILEDAVRLAVQAKTLGTSRER